jgi:hypothetical protein
MKKILLLCMLMASFACSKKSESRPCYDCDAPNIGTGGTYNEKVCTDGQPEDQLPQSDAFGQLSWHCVKR